MKRLLFTKQNLRYLFFYLYWNYIQRALVKYAILLFVFNSSFMFISLYKSFITLSILLCFKLNEKRLQILKRTLNDFSSRCIKKFKNRFQFNVLSKENWKKEFLLPDYKFLICRLFCFNFMELNVKRFQLHKQVYME